MTSADVAAAHGRATESARRIWVLSLLLVVALGACIRLVHLNTKWYFNDEMKTALHVSGQTVPDISHYRVSHSITSGELAATFQAPIRGVGWPMTVRALAEEDSQHPPLYYLVERFMEEVFGDSVSARRLLAALAGAALVPAVYWLTLELGAAFAAALLAALLVAVSPYQLVYSQEVREWTLFELLATITSALLLHALRRGSVRAWVAYSTALLLAFYSAILSLVLLAAFAIWTFTSRGPPDRSRRRPFAIASGISFALYLPWMYELATNWKRANAENGWMAAALPLKLYAAKAIFGLSAVFFDSEYTQIRTAIVLLPVAAAAAVALWWFLRWESPRTKSFVITLLGVSPVTFFVADVLLRASRGTAERYFLLSAIALEIAVALGCGAALRHGKRAGAAAVASGTVLVLAGAVSCAIDVRSPLSWENNDAGTLAAAGALIDRDRAVVVTNPYVGLEIANLTPADTPLVLGPPFPSLGRATLDVLDASDAQLAKIRQERSEPGSAIPFAAAEPAMLAKIHAGVSAAHGRSMRSDTLWRFAQLP